MQTTLLGVAIAFILALLAALIGPYFVDWDQFKPRFEVEASRILGAPVRVDGALDARLLPTPTLRLRQLSVGKPNDPGRIAAERLDVEFSLGSLMRGEARAAELSIDGLVVNLGLDAQGRMVTPTFSGYGNLGGLSVDRLNITGKVGFYDAASKSTLSIDDISFSGDVRAQTASVRGEGQLSYHGERYPFRLSSGQTNDGNGTRMRFGIEPGARPLSAYIDGVLSFPAGAPRFEGALSVVRTAALKSTPQGAVLQTPWRVTANVKADPASATFEQAELSYGAEDNNFKLAGAADARFGVSPLLHVVLSAKQLDADRLLVKEGASTDPSQLVTTLRELVGALPQPPLPVQAEIGVDSITLGGRPVQNVGLDLRSDDQGWRVNRLELRAPGATQVTLSGAATARDGLSGAINIESADPDLLAMWLAGRNEAILRDRRAMRLRGRLNVTSARAAIDDMVADLGSGELRGKVAWLTTQNGGSRLDADITTALLDIDATLALARTLSNTKGELPREGAVALKADIAKWAGEEWKPFAVVFDFAPNALRVTSLSAGSAGGMSAQGSGAVDLANATGSVVLTATDVSVARIAALLNGLAPDLAKRLTVSGETERTKLSVTATLEKAAGGRGNARVALDVDGARTKATLVATGVPKLDDVRADNLDAIASESWTVDLKSQFQKDARLLALVPFGDTIRKLAADDAVTLDVTSNGPLRAPLTFKASISSPSLDASADGRAELWPKDSARIANAEFALIVRRANAAALLDQSALLEATMTTRVSASGDLVMLRDIDSRIGGSRVRGRLSIVPGDEPMVEGELGADAINLGVALTAAIGASDADASTPLRRGLMRGWRGAVAFQALRGTLPGGVELRPIAATLKANGNSFSAENITGTLGGGALKADISARPDFNGLVVDARAQLTNVEGKALRYRSLTMPAARAGLQMTLASRGRSASALANALSGAGTLNLQDVRIAGLDPSAFDAAMRAGDAAQISDAEQVKALVAPVLANGALATPNAQVAFVVSDGRLRVSPTALDGGAAKAIVSGGYDIAADQLDMRAQLSSSALPGRPEILVLALGTPDAPVTTLDVTSLSSWLAVRAIDRETRRLDAIERGEQPPLIAVPPAVPQVVVPPLPRAAPVRPQPSPPQAAIAPPGEVRAAPPLPPAIEVKPAPGPRPSPPRPRPPAPLVLTPSLGN